MPNEPLRDTMTPTQLVGVILDRVEAVRVRITASHPTIDEYLDSRESWEAMLVEAMGAAVLLRRYFEVPR